MKMEKNSKNILLYGVILFVILLPVSFLINMPSAVHEWTSGWYAMDYSFGFGSRLLIGSIFKLFFPEFLSAETVYYFVIITITIILITLILLFAYVLFKSPDAVLRDGLSLLFILYLASPGSIAYLWSSEIFGRFDTYLVLFIILCVFFCLKVTSYRMRCIIIFCLGSLCLAIHQVFLFLFFPVIFAILLLPLDFGVGTFSLKKLDKELKKNILMGGAVILLLCIQFLFYQFGSSISISSSSELAALLSARTNLPVMENALYFEYFASFKETLSEIAFNEIGERIRYTVIAWFILSPIFFIYGYLWISIIRKENKTSEKIKYLFLLLSLISYLPAFVLTKDWGRWTCAFLLTLLLQIILIAMTKKEAVTAAFLSLNRITYKFRFLLVLYIILIALMEKYQCILLPQAPDIFQFIYRIFKH